MAQFNPPIIYPYIGTRTTPYLEDGVLMPNGYQLSEPYETSLGDYNFYSDKYGKKLLDNMMLDTTGYKSSDSLKQDEKFREFKLLGDDNNPTGIGDYVRSGLSIANFVGDMASDIRNSNASQVQGPSFVDYNTNTYNRASDLRNLERKWLDPSNINRLGVGEAAADFGIKTAKGAALGAKLGTQIAPGWGTAIGAIAGAAVGNVGSLTNTFTRKARESKDFSKNFRLNNEYRNNFMDAQNNVLQNIRTSTNNMMNNQRLTNTYAQGGGINEYGGFDVNVFGNGGTHEENPNGGVQQGYGQNGQPNYVEEGEVKWNNFIFSNRVKPDVDILRQFNSGFNKKFNTYADVAKRILELHKERENNPYDRQTLDIQMSRLADAQEYQKIAEEAADNGVSVDEYLAYLSEIEQRNQMQQMQQAQQTQQMQQSQPMLQMQQPQQELPEETQFAYGGNFFGEGGAAEWHTGKYNGFSVRRYFGRHNGRPGTNDAAYVIDEFLNLWDILNSSGRELNPDEKRRYDELERRMVDYMKKDPEAQMYFLVRGMNAYRRSYEFMNADLEKLRSKYNLPSVKVKDPKANIKSFVFDYDTTPDLSQLELDDQLQANSSLESTETETPPIRPIGSSVTSGGGGSRTVVPNIRYYDPKTRTFVNERVDEYSAPVNFIRSGNNYNGLYVTNPNGYYEQWWAKNQTDDLKNEFFNYYNSDAYSPTNDINGRQYNKWIPKSADQLVKEATNDPWGAAHQAWVDWIYSKAGVPTEAQPAESGLPYTKTIRDLEPTTNPQNTNQLDTNNNIKTGKRDYNYPYIDPLRYAPVMNGMRQVLEQNEPDFTYANQLASLYRPMNYQPTGQYQRYQPIDQYYADTQANQQGNTLYGYYRNNTAGNGNLANLYATIGANSARGNRYGAYANTIQYNNQMRNSALAYNNQLDQANEAARRTVQQTNYNNYANWMQQSYAAAEQEKLAVENARETNRQNLANVLGRIGKENTDYHHVATNPALLYGPWGEYYKRANTTD